MDRVEFTVPGKPMTWARARANTDNGLRFYTPDDRVAHMDSIKAGWFDEGYDAFGRDVDLVLQCRFVFPRPSSHFGSGRNSEMLRESARRLRPHGGKFGGDLDNLYKLVKDALNGVAYHDDNQIVEYGPEHGKFYCDPGEMPRTEVAIWPAVTAIAPAYVQDAQGSLLAA